MSVKVDNERGTVYDQVKIRVDESFTLEMHIDTDEANAVANTEDPSGVILKLFGGTAVDLREWSEEIHAVKFYGAVWTGQSAARRSF